MTDVMPEQQVVDLDAFVDGEEKARGVNELDAVDDLLESSLARNGEKKNRRCGYYARAQTLVEECR